MFKPAPMVHFTAVVLERNERQVLEGLGRLGVMQLSRAPADEEALVRRDSGSDIARYDRLRARVEEIRRHLEIPEPPDTVKAAAMDLEDAEETVRTMEGQVMETLDLRRAYRQRQREADAACEQVGSFRSLDIPLDSPDHYSFLHFVTGTIPAENVAALRTALGKDVAIATVGEPKGRQSLIAMTTREASSLLEESLQKAGFQREVLPAQEGKTADDFCAEKEREHQHLQEELERLNTRAKALAEELIPELHAIEVMLARELGLARAQQNLGRTDATVIISGWVPAHHADAASDCLKDTAGDARAVEIEQPEDVTDGQVPTLLMHSRLLRPFGMLLSSYGVPNYRELEPTLFVAISYVLMFGIMFGDAGQGAILAAIGVYAIIKGKTKTIKDVGILMCACGLSSVVFGIIYGSVFGIEYFKHHALWHDPLEGDPMGLMYGAITVGIVLISLGLILNVINRFRRGDIIGAFLDKFGVAGLVFYWGVLSVLLAKGFFESRGLTNIALIIFLALPALCWVAKEPLEYFLHRSRGHGGGHTLGEAITESCVGAFEAVLSYLANTISFVRLGAYAMSHAALLVAAFMLAEQVRHLAGGSVWNIIVIILGNIVAIVLEGIIASVQALRLEYYEFFGKFFSGDGQAFQPFRLTGRSRSEPS